MLEIDKLKAKLLRDYQRDSGFMVLANHDNYPYEINLKGPTLNEILRNPLKVKAWQQSYEQSKLAPYLVMETRRARGTMGEQRVLVKVSFPTRDALENFIAPQNCVKQDKRRAASEAKKQKTIASNSTVNNADTPDISDSSPSFMQGQSFVETMAAARAAHGSANASAATAAVAYQQDEASLQDPYEIHAPLGSFSAFDEICELVVEPLNAQLHKKSPAFSLRQRGMATYLRQNARTVSEMGSDFIRAMAFVDYMASQPQTPYVYYRQLAIPHVDTKFIERNYNLLNDLLLLCLDSSRRKDLVSSLDPDNTFFSYARGSKRQAAESAFALINAKKEEAEAGVAAVEVSYDSLPMAGAEAEAEAGVETDGAAAKSDDKQHSDLEDSIEALSAGEPPFVVDKRMRGLPLFTKRWGFKPKPELVRMRFLDPKQVVPLCAEGHNTMLDLTMSLDALANLAVPFAHVIICENEVTFLSLPQISNTIAIFGSGYEVAQLGPLANIAASDVIYWGDIDTHGFAILNALRTTMLRSARSRLKAAGDEAGANNLSARSLNVRSMLMDSETLLRNWEWVVQEKEQTITVLENLIDDEYFCYEDLISNKHGKRLRLEQELIPFHQVVAALKKLLPKEKVIAPDAYWHMG